MEKAVRCQGGVQTEEREETELHLRQLRSWSLPAALTVAVGGNAQALLLNYEEELTSQFGDKSSLATRLRFPVFIGSVTDEGQRALRRLCSQLPAPLRTYIAEYDAGLDEDVANDPHYEFRLRVVQELTKKDADALAVQFTRFDDLTDEQRATVEEMGK
jgi:hypothetical protein